jgi:hypothetical protein
VGRENHQAAAPLRRTRDGDNADHARLQRSKRILTQLQESYDTVDFYLDDSPVSIYKLSIPGEQEAPQVQHLYIRERNGNLAILAHESAIISKIPKRVRTVRIFAEVDENTLEEIREKVKNFGENVMIVTRELVYSICARLF